VFLPENPPSAIGSAKYPRGLRWKWVGGRVARRSHEGKYERCPHPIGSQFSSLKINLCDLCDQFPPFPEAKAGAFAYARATGSAYVSLTDALKPLNRTTAEERRSSRLLNIQILAPVEDSEGRPVGVLVANVLTRQLLWPIYPRTDRCLGNAQRHRHYRSRGAEPPA